MSRLTSGGKAVISMTFSRETCHRVAPHIRRQSRHQTRPFQGRLVTVSRLLHPGGKAVIKHGLFKEQLVTVRRPRLTSGGKAVIKHDLFKGDLSPFAPHPAAKPSSNTTFSRETCHRVAPHIRRQSRHQTRPFQGLIVAAPHIRRQSRHQTRPFQGRLGTVAAPQSGGKAVMATQSKTLDR